MSTYNTKALFNQNMSNIKQQNFLEFYVKIYSSYNIKTIHDCTVGAGGTTIFLSKLGYIVKGSYLSENLIEKARSNFLKSGFSVDLFVSDLKGFHENRMVWSFSTETLVNSL